MERDDAENAVALLTWERIGARLAAGAAAILPIGAGAKQHGLHLPMSTDQILAEHLARAISRNMDALVWPALTYGHYPAFTRYAGSVSLSAATFESVVGELVEGLIGFGARSVIVLNTGLSTIAPVDRAIAAALYPGRIIHIKAFSGPRYEKAAADVRQQKHGSHADEMETSIMLALAPHLVDMARARASPQLPGGPRPGPLDPSDPASANYSPSGSFGDPRLATLQKGRMLLEAIEADVRAAAILHHRQQY